MPGMLPVFCGAATGILPNMSRGMAKGQFLLPLLRIPFAVDDKRRYAGRGSRYQSGCEGD
jgi:hypothetical protein